MRKSLDYRVSWAGKHTAEVTVGGRISEAAHDSLRQLAGELESATLIVVDVSAVESVNSIGVREWLSFVQACRERGSAFEFHRCSVAFITQVNMVAGFADPASIRSIYLPFLCDACGAGEDVLSDVKFGQWPAVEPPTCSCGELMSFDDVEEAYFAFLTSS